jgi:hypothetical protein
MFNFSYFSVKVCINVSSHSKTLMKMFLMYYENTCSMTSNESNWDKVFKTFIRHHN